MPSTTHILSLIALSALLAACTNAPEKEPPKQSAQQAMTAALQDSGPAQPVRIQNPFREDAPHTYTVKPGDTLWGLAQRFLRDPWAWPEIWYDNPQVRNPHRIYPGDQLVITHIDGQMRLTKKLSPRVRIVPQEKAITTLPLGMLQPFLNYPQVIEVAELNRAPQIIGSPDGRLVLGHNDIFHTYGAALEPRSIKAVVRPHKSLLDPVTEELLGYEAEVVGKAIVLTGDDPATLRMIESNREARKADRVVSLAPELGHDLILSAPAKPVKGMVISLPDTTTMSAQAQIIAINKGRIDGMAPGHVIRLHQQGKVVRVSNTPIPDPRGTTESETKNLFERDFKEVQLPDVTLGDAVVFQVYERVSYALITETTQPVTVGDCFTTRSESCR